MKERGNPRNFRPDQGLKQSQRSGRLRRSFRSRRSRRLLDLNPPKTYRFPDLGQSICPGSTRIASRACPIQMSETKDKPAANPSETEVPKAVVSRLSLYLRELEHMVRDGNETTSSSRLGRALGFTDAQVRRDLTYFGHFGYPGVGYRCEELISAIKKIMGTDQQWSAALVGAGNLGRALLGYGGFRQRGFSIQAVFDSDPKKVGERFEGLKVMHLDGLPDFAKANRIRLGILAVPATAAQAVADRLVAVGVEGILNFAPVTISLPPSVSQVAVDLAIELEQLSFSVVNRASGAT